MRRFLLDTGIAADYVFRRGLVYERAREQVAQGHKIGVSLPVLGELFAGVENSTSRERNRPRMVHQVEDLAQWPFDRTAAEEYGRIYANLRRIGRPMQQIDIQTAAIAVSLAHCTLITRDSDFGAIADLSIEAW